MRLDLHVHLAAAGVPGGELSARFRRTLPYRYLARSIGALGAADPVLSKLYADAVVAAALAARELDGFVLLALDRPHSEVGLPLRADLHVSNELAAEVCRRAPGRLFLGASVHPYRPDALEALDAAKAQGAVLIKWLPPTQGLDPASPRCRPFYRRLRELSLPLLSHTGDEHTLTGGCDRLGDPLRLEPALAEGVTVFAAHAGLRGRLGRRQDFGPLVALCERQKRLFLECSGVWTPGRYGAFRRLLALPALRDRWLFGSDYPVPIFWPLLWGRSDPALRRLAKRATPFDARALAARAAGLPERAFTRAAELCGIG